MNFADIVFDDLAAGNVLEYDDRESEIEFQLLPQSKPVPPMRRHRREVLSIVPDHMRVWKSGNRLACLAHHLAADIHRVDFAEETGERARHPPGAATDFQHAHIFRLASLADVG